MYPVVSLFIPIRVKCPLSFACAEVVLPAVAQNGNAFCYAARLLRNDPNIAFQAATRDRVTRDFAVVMICLGYPLVCVCVCIYIYII